MLNPCCKLILIAGCLSGWLLQTHQILKIYYNYETITQVSTKYSDDICFPAVTICANNRIRRDIVCNQNPYQEGMAYCNPGKFTKTFRTPNFALDIYSVLRLINSSEMIRLSENNQKFSIFHTCKELQNNGYENHSLCKNIVDSFSGRYTACRTYNFDFDEDANFCYRAKGQEVWLEIKYKYHFEPGETPGAKITISNPHSIPDITQNFNTIQPNTSYDISIHKLTWIMLPTPYNRKLICINYQRRWNANNSNHISLQNCIYSCARRLSMSTCGCLVYMSVIPEWDYHLKCDMDKNPNVTENKHCNNYSVPQKFTKKCSEECPPTCKRESYVLTLVSKPFEHMDQAATTPNDVSQLKIIFEEHTVFEQKPKVEMVEILSYLGGITGMWLGFSIYSFGLWLKLNAVALLKWTRKKNNSANILLTSKVSKIHIKH